MASPTISKQRETANEVIAAFNAWDMERIMGFRSDDCMHQVLPKSLGREPMDNAAFREYFTGMIPAFKGFTLTVHELVESKEERKIAIWLSSVADSVLGPYHNAYIKEYCLILYFNEDGDKVVKFLEFIDSKWSVDFFGKLRAFLAEKEKAKEVKTE